METDSRLGRREPTDFDHVDKYPVRRGTAQMPGQPVPVIWGINWYESFSNPVKDNRGVWWAGRDHRNLGRILGGHCVCSPTSPDRDAVSWYGYYDQGREGACVGFGSSRAMSLIERVRFDARWLYKEAQLVDEWSDTPPEEGTSVRAAIDVLRRVGHRRHWDGKSGEAKTEYGVKVNRWATSIDDVLACLMSPAYQKMGAIPFFNSWGRSFPRKVWVPLESWARVLDEHGEATVFTPN